MIVSYQNSGPYRSVTYKNVEVISLGAYIYTLRRSSADYHKYQFRTPVVQGHDSVVGPNYVLQKHRSRLVSRVLNSK